MFFVPKKMPKKWQFIFIYDNYINFIHTWGNFDRPIKVTPSAIKVTPFDGVTLFDRSLIQNIQKLSKSIKVTLFHGI